MSCSVGEEAVPRCSQEAEPGFPGQGLRVRSHDAGGNLEGTTTEDREEADLQVCPSSVF